MSAGADPSRRPDRPLLAGGEALRRDIARGPRGGPKFHPQTLAEAQAHLQPQVEQIRTAVEAMPDLLRGQRVVIEATLLPNYLAASYFPTALLEAADLVPLGTRPAVGLYRTPHTEQDGYPTKRLLLGGTDHSLRRLQAIIEGRLQERRAGPAQEALRELGDIALPSAEDVVRRDDAPTEAAAGSRELWEAVLHPLELLDWRPEASVDHVNLYDKWRRLVGELDGTTIDSYRRTAGGLTFVPTFLASEVLEQAASFNALRTIRPIPTMRPITGTRLRRVAGLVPPRPLPAGVAPRSALRVAIFDGGIDNNAPLLDPYVTEIDRTPEPKESDDVMHGAAVTAAALYGYVLPGEPLTVPPARVDHYRVFPDQDPADPDAYWVLDQIVDVVSKNDYALVNLSLGPDQPIDDDTPHLWTIELDRLAYEKGTLFVNAVGNSGLRTPAGEDRIQPASDMVNGVGVGSCTARPPALPWERAPYSSVGPGRPGARIQPTGVAFGGVDANPFHGLLGDGSFVTADAGTSFSAPLCTHALAQLAADLGHQRASASMLRAFAIHFAEPHGSAALSEIGFGRLPETFSNVWLNDDSSVTLLYQDNLLRDQVAAVQLPWPDSLQSGRVSLRWTLTFTSSIDATDPVDYTRSGIELTFRPHSRRWTFNGEDGRPIGTVNLDDEAAVNRLLARGGSPAANPATRSPHRVFEAEGSRREAGKWETVIHQHDRLVAKSLHRPQLELAHLARDSGLLVSENVPPLEYSLIVTVDGPPGLYDAVRAQYPVLTPIRPATQIAIRT